MKTKLHHFGYAITSGKLELVIELFEKMGCRMSYRRGSERWCMIAQGEIPVRMQIIETDCQPTTGEDKTNTHIAFLSDNPSENIEEIKAWAKNKGLNFRNGGWSENELWFDFPDIFINFVVEIMLTSLVE